MEENKILGITKSELQSIFLITLLQSITIIITIYFYTH